MGFPMVLAMGTPSPGAPSAWVQLVPFVAIFDEDQGTFMIIDRLGWHVVEPGDCILARGTVELMRQTRPVIDVQGELERCD